MIVSELAKRAEVTPETVRYYTRIGLLKPQRDPENGYKLYSFTDFQKLRLTKKARLMGFSLKEINILLERAENRENHCPDVRELMASKRSSIEDEINELHRRQSLMDSSAALWDSISVTQATNSNTVLDMIEKWEASEDSYESEHERQSSVRSIVICTNFSSVGNVGSSLQANSERATEVATSTMSKERDVCNCS